MLSLVFAAWLSLLSAPKQAPPLRPVDNIVNVNFVPDVRVFTVMAAINVAGFNVEGAGRQMHPLRIRLRSQLEALPQDLKTRLKRFYESRKVELDDRSQQTKYLSFALAIGPPPQFPPVIKASALPRPVADLLGFEAVLSEFYTKAQIPAIWPEYRQEYLREIESYKPVLRQTIVEALEYMRTPARIMLDRQIIVIPDLLGPYGVTNARIIGGSYYLILGPGQPEDNRPQLRHEYLHFVIDPLAEKYVAQILKHSPALLKIVQQQPSLEAQFRGDLLLVFSESLINAVNLRIEQAGAPLGSPGPKPVPPERVEAQLVKDYDRGLILEPAMYEFLKRFEAQPTSLPEWFENLISAIDPKVEEHERPAQIAAMRQRQTAATAPSAPAPPAYVEKLHRANALLQQGQWDAARSLLREVLDVDADNGSAWFGLAQIAAHDSELEAALENYRKVTSSERAAGWIRAWSHVRAAGILEFLERSGEARVELEKALAVAGDVRGAHEEARKRLEKLRP